MGRKAFKLIGWLLFAAYGFCLLVFWLFAMDMLIKGEARRLDYLVLAVLLAMPAAAMAVSRQKSKRRPDETKQQAKRRLIAWIYLGVLYALVLALTALFLAGRSWGILFATCALAACGILGAAIYLKNRDMHEADDQKRVQNILDTPMEDLVSKYLDDDKRI